MNTERPVEDRRPLGRLLQEARKARGWSISETVAAAGLLPQAHFAERLVHIEEGRYRFPTDEELDGLAEALGLEAKNAWGAFDEECTYYDGLPGKPRVVMRLIPAFYSTLRYPDGLSTREILEFAGEKSSTMDRKVCVILQDGKAVYIEPGGERFESERPPYMRLYRNNEF